MKRIKLTNCKLYALVDDEDFEYLSQFKWRISPYGYAIRSTWFKGKRGTTYMHREIMNTPSNLSTDHINGDKLNNCKNNLRICEEAKNRFNSKLYKNSTTGLKGVRLHRSKWQARIAIDGKRVHLGTFDTPLAAAKAYDIAALELHGEFARLNAVA